MRGTGTPGLWWPVARSLADAVASSRNRNDEPETQPPLGSVLRELEALSLAN